MIKQIEISNLGPIPHLKWDNLGSMNLIIGKNASGKTYILKALYSSIKAIEGFKRGREQRSIAELLYDKMYWTFETESLGDLVTKASKSSPLEVKLKSDKAESFHFSFGRDTKKQINNVDSSFKQREADSVFIPAKEILSLYSVILTSRERDNALGFDDTYYDLVKALRPTSRGKNYASFSNAREKFSDMLDGRIEFDETANSWFFQSKSRARFTIGSVAEGIKKLSIFDTLLGNRYLTPDSIVFIDEPEANLHPAYIVKYLDIISLLAEAGIQFFITSHSYFVIKKLLLLAKKSNKSVPLLLFDDDLSAWRSDDLLTGMPENSIVNESIALYEEEVNQIFS